MNVSFVCYWSMRKFGIKCRVYYFFKVYLQLASRFFTYNATEMKEMYMWKQEQRFTFAHVFTLLQSFTERTAVPKLAVNSVLTATTLALFKHLFSQPRHGPCVVGRLPPQHGTFQGTDSRFTRDCEFTDWYFAYCRKLVFSSVEIGQGTVNFSL